MPKQQFEFNEWMSEKLQDHLIDHLPDAVEAIDDIQHAIHELSGKENKCIRIIKQHMMTCGGQLNGLVVSRTSTH